MQGPLDFALPRQGVDDLVQSDRSFGVGERLALFVEQLQVGDKAEWIGHGDDAGHEANPIPRHPSGTRVAFGTPKGLAGARTLFVAEVQHPGAEMSEMELRRSAGLPQ